jgi:hypothetical protein
MKTYLYEKCQVKVFKKFIKKNTGIHKLLLHADPISEGKYSSELPRNIFTAIGP